jgi:hypothetical protein
MTHNEYMLRDKLLHIITWSVLAFFAPLSVYVGFSHHHGPDISPVQTEHVAFEHQVHDVDGLSQNFCLFCYSLRGGLISSGTILTQSAENSRITFHFYSESASSDSFTPFSSRAPPFTLAG